MLRTFQNCALLDNGDLKCWGANSYGQLGLGDEVDRGDEPGEMGDNLPAVDLGAGRSVLQVSVGWVHACAVLDDLSLKCWGSNLDGELGAGSRVEVGDGPGEMGDNLSAVDVGSNRSVRSVSAGTRTTCVVLTDGGAKCWGDNGYGNLGQGDTITRGDNVGEMGDALVDIDLGPGRTADLIDSRYVHACAVLDASSVKCWGYNGDGQLGLGDDLDRGDEPSEMGSSLPETDLGVQAAQRGSVALYADQADAVFATGAATEADLEAGVVSLTRRDLQTGVVDTLVADTSMSLYDVTSDGAFALIRIDDRLERLDVSTGNRTAVTSAALRSIAPRISDDGSVVTFVTNESLDASDTDAGLDLYSTVVGSNHRLVDIEYAPTSAVPLSTAAEDLVIVASDTGAVLAVDMAGAGGVVQFRDTDERASWVDITGDGQYVSWVEGTRSVYVYDVDGDGDAAFDDSSEAVVWSPTIEVHDTYGGSITAPPRISSSGRLSFAISSVAPCLGGSDAPWMSSGVAAAQYSIASRAFERIEEVAVNPEAPDCQETQTAAFSSTIGPPRLIVATNGEMTPTVREFDASTVPSVPVTLTLFRVDPVLNVGSGDDDWYPYVEMGDEIFDDLWVGDGNADDHPGGILQEKFFTTTVLTYPGLQVRTNLELRDEDADNATAYDVADINPDPARNALSFVIDSITGDTEDDLPPGTQHRAGNGFDLTARVYLSTTTLPNGINQALDDDGTGSQRLPAAEVSYIYPDGDLDRDGVDDIDGDADNDGILDGIERLGYDADPSTPGIEVPLDDWGADPQVPDIFVEVDEIDGFELDDSIAQFDEAISEFNRNGLTLHIDSGPFREFATPGDSRSDLLPGTTLTAPVELFDDFNAVRDGDPSATPPTQPAFNADRRPFFRYAIFGPPYNDGRSNTSSGRSDGIGASQFYVRGDLRSAQSEALTFWHELGHNVGLRHGGNENDNRKPNYLSLMNYLYSFAGVPGAAGPVNRFNDQTLVTLVNGTLNEADGITGGDATTTTYLAADGLGFRYTCPDGTAVAVGDATAPADINCDTPPGGPDDVADTGIGFAIDPPIDDDDLESFNDWENLTLIEGSISGLGAKPPIVPESEMEREPVAPIAPSGERPYELFVTGVDVALRPGQSRVVPVTARNVGLEGAVWSIRTEDFRAPDGVTVSGLPASIDLTTEQQVVLMVEVTAAPTAAPGAFGRISVLFDDPTAPDVDRYTGSARIGIDIVDASGAVGPAAASDIIESPASGVVFDPTVNDTEGDAPLDPSTLTIVAPPLDGTLEVTQDIQLAYTPGPAGEDSAVYQICDTNNSCANATLTMYQTAATGPFPPVASDDLAVTLSGTTSLIDVLGNDADLDNDIEPSTLSIVVAPSLGQATLEADGESVVISYSSGASAGVEALTYEVCDSGGRCDTAEVEIRIVSTADCTIVGTMQSDFIIGTAGDDIICALGGDDVVDGGDGNDIVFAGPGVDTVSGGPGDDLLDGDQGDDQLFGDAGNDEIYGGNGADAIDGGAGRDQLIGQQGDDELLGGTGNDWLFGDRGNDRLDGGDGYDRLDGGKGINLCTLGELTVACS